jgi:hypothetical protein
LILDVLPLRFAISRHPVTQRLPVHTLEFTLLTTGFPDCTIPCSLCLTLRSGNIPRDRVDDSYKTTASTHEDSFRSGDGFSSGVARLELSLPSIPNEMTRIPPRNPLQVILVVILRGPER